MSNLAYPQLSSGAMVQFPLRKRRVIQSTVNAFADGSMIVSNINSNTQRVWELFYTDLTSADQVALQNHFAACQGPLQPFIFIDPTDNMLNSSSSLLSATWTADPLLSVKGGAADPNGGSSAFTLINSADIDQEIRQQVNAPAGFQYSFSLYASAPSATTLKLGRSANTSEGQAFAVEPNWVRLVNSEQLADEGIGFAVSIIVPAAQTVVVWGPQLEPQLSPSRYRATASSGGVYPNAHLVGNSITFASEAPGLFSTVISIETT